ncbi:hypothetical protein N7468_003905 [Penicillium chermesinum]|uniref:Uncharacterized protein n=1 Tax=Penicillium chermesinum TaxID=63820 RepID=A0A9W9TS23_9EURO|nr:uncharacterized protein N7468_003905 [Penicillium chermesinum]KAJ5239286.1 hypothetical protein N7468_003905 [Penicillium chermesinum]
MMMRIRDLVKSLQFYVDLLGMRTVFIMNAGPFTIYYLGYTQITEHQVDIQRLSYDTLTPLVHTLGLLELYHIHGTENEPEGNHSPESGIRPSGTLDYLKTNGVQVEKNLRVATRASIPLTEWEAQRRIGVDHIHPACQSIFNQIRFVKNSVSKA